MANSTQVGRLLVVIIFTREINFFFSCISRVIFTIFLPFLKVHLNREHHYNNQDQIQSELSGYVMELAPYDLPRNTKVPFLSLGGEIDVGIRQERCRGKSETSGGILFFTLKLLHCSSIILLFSEECIV